MNEELWCLHILGPDDVHAAPSKEDAEEVASVINQRFASNDVGLSAVAVRWPHSAESHAEDLPRWDEWA